jgi:hypothetical protein
MAAGIVISAAVEGIVDEAVVRKLIAHADATLGDVYGKQGKSFLRQKIAAAAQRLAASAGAASLLSRRRSRGRSLAAGRRRAPCGLP